jgi:LysM repeat protein
MFITGDQSVQSAAAKAPPPPPSTEGTVTHTVKSGETVGELSERYGVSEKQILAANPQVRHPDDLSDGQEISIPVADNGGQTPTQTQVHPGDTLTAIAKSHGVSVSALATANGITHPNQVRAGTQLWIPVKGSPEAGVANSANPFQQQIAAVDASVKQYQSAHSPTQRQAASAAVTQSVEQELSARASAELPRGQLPSDSQLASYGTAITSRYANNAGLTQAIQHGVSNEAAAVRTSDTLKQVEAAQQALQHAGPHASQTAKSQLEGNLTAAQNELLSQTEREVQTRAGLGTGQLPSAAQIQQYGTVIAQRYAGDPTAAKAVSAALQTVPSDVEAQKLVAQARSVSDPNKALTNLNQAYTKASAPVQQRILAQAGTQTILKAAAAEQMQPLSQAQHAQGDFLQQGWDVRQSLQNLDKSASQLDPTLAAGLVQQALPQLDQFNSLYAKEYGGAGIASDPLHIGASSVATVMDLSGRIAGTAQGAQDVAHLAKLGFWNNSTVSNALYGGASAAYPEAVARLEISQGQDPTNVLSIIQEGVQADQQRVKGDVQALGQHNEELSWLIQNVGPSMTSSQLQTAISQYENQKGWSTQNTQLTQKVIADATTLTQNMKSLSSLAQAAPQATANLDVRGTLSASFNDPATSYGLTLAAGQNPGLYADSKGQSLLSTVSGLKLADQGRKTAQLIGSMYVRNMITTALSSNVNWRGADPLGEAQEVLNSLKSPALSNWMGVNDNTVWNSAVKIVQKNLVAPGDDQAVMQQKLGDMNQALDKLKALSSATPAGQLLRSVAVAYAFTNTVNSYQKFQSAEGAPDKTITGLETLTAAAGLLQKGANLANGFGLVKSGTLMSSFAKDTANGTISLVSGGLDLVEGIRSLSGFGEQQDIPDGVFSTMSGLGGVAYGASQFAEAGAFDAVGQGVFGVTGGSLAAGLGLVGVGVVAASVLGSAIYKQYQQDHQFEGATQSFLEGSGGFSSQAASALSHEDGLISGAGGASGVPFLAKYADMKHLSPTQLQGWLKTLSSSQLQTLDQCLLQTAADAHGNPANFTNGPEQEVPIINYSGGFSSVVPLNNTLGVFESNLKAGGVSLPG